MEVQFFAAATPIVIAATTCSHRYNLAHRYKIIGEMSMKAYNEGLDTNSDVPVMKSTFQEFAHTFSKASDRAYEESHLAKVGNEPIRSGMNLQTQAVFKKRLGEPTVYIQTGPLSVRGASISSFDTGQSGSLTILN